MRERILSKVLLPAPLRPRIPMDSPCRMSKSTSLSAQKVSRSCALTPNGCLTRSTIASLRFVGRFRLWEMTYDLLSPRTETARSLDDIGEAALLLLEDHHSHPENRKCHYQSVGERSQRGSTPAEKRPAECLQQAGERIQPEDPEKLLTELGIRHRPGHRADEQA